MSALLDRPEVASLVAGRRGPAETERRTGVVQRFRQRFRLGAFSLLAALGLSFLLMPQALVPDGGLREELVHDFRGRPLPPGIVPFGPQADRFIKVEAEGLRITLPRDRDDFSPVGLSMPLALAGDFEITTAFEILQADEPAPGRLTYGVGVLMSVNEAARVGYLSRATRQVVTWDRWATVAGKPQFLNGALPCMAKVGRLRLKRTGTTLLFLWAPATEGDNFAEIHQCEFGADDITLLRLELTADTGGQAGSLDVRLLDLKIRSNTPAADQAFASEEGRATRSKRWLTAAGILGLAIFLLLAVGLAVRQRRRTEKTPVRDPVPAGQAQPEAASASVSFPCSGCGKRLKAGAALTGKKVKCPQCGQAVVVPRTPPSA